MMLMMSSMSIDYHRTPSKTSRQGKVERETINGYNGTMIKYNDNRRHRHRMVDDETTLVVVVFFYQYTLIIILNIYFRFNMVVL